MGLCSKPRKSLLALNQMMSKGTIQAEELRGQLALPGAFELWRLVGVTEKNLLQ
jgi:tape measure domain-containing protein